MREIRTSGSVRDGDGNVPIYSALGLAQGREVGRKNGAIGEVGLLAEKDEPPGLVQGDEPVEEQPPEQARQHPHGQEEAGAAGDPAASVW